MLAGKVSLCRFSYTQIITFRYEMMIFVFSLSTGWLLSSTPSRNTFPVIGVPMWHSGVTTLFVILYNKLFLSSPLKPLYRNLFLPLTVYILFHTYVLTLLSVLELFPIVSLTLTFTSFTFSHITRVLWASQTIDL